MRLIDADKAFDKFFEMWGIEVDAGIADMFMKVINDMPTIAPPPNAPLTLDELREMDGEPVWVERPGYSKFWALVLAWGEAADAVYLIHSNGSATFALTVFDCGGKIYRRKPEGADVKNTVDTPAKNL